MRRLENITRAFLAAAAVAGLFLTADARADEEGKTDLRFQFDLRATALYGSVSSGDASCPTPTACSPSKSTSSSAFMLGFQLGGSAWFTKAFGVLFLTGADGGYLLAPHDGTIIVDWELGPELLLGGDHRRGTVFSLTWAPKVFVNVRGGAEVASPEGIELAFNIYGLKLPFWLLHTLDGATFFGGALALGY
jgi:hypothetical protein